MELHFLAKGSFLSNQQAVSLTYTEKNDVIIADPVSCAWNFKNTASSFVHQVHGKELDIMGGLKDHFLRDETQGRGSMHEHGVGWPQEAARVYHCESNEAIVTYVDVHISCDIHATAPLLP